MILFLQWHKWPNSNYKKKHDWPYVGRFSSDVDWTFPDVVRLLLAFVDLQLFAVICFWRLVAGRWHVFLRLPSDDDQCWYFCRQLCELFQILSFDFLISDGYTRHTIIVLAINFVHPIQLGLDSCHGMVHYYLVAFQSYDLKKLLTMNAAIFYLYIKRFFKYFVPFFRKRHNFQKIILRNISTTYHCRSFD